MKCKTISNNQNEDIVGKEENLKRKNNSFNEKNISLDEYNLYSKDLNKPLVLNENQEEQKIEKTDKKNEFINEMKNEIDENNKIKGKYKNTAQKAEFLRKNTENKVRTLLRKESVMTLSSHQIALTMNTTCTNCNHRLNNIPSGAQRVDVWIHKDN